MLAALAQRDARPLTLRYVVFAGEYLDLQALRPWLDRFGDSAPELINMYGITETTVHSTYAALTKQDLDSPVRSRIGRPLPHVRIYLLDSHGDPVPLGVPGEIWVAGPSVARGYQGLDDLTADRFRPDPFAGPDADGPRMYRSGDLGRRLEDGELEILGRIDAQLKVRGYRVEPGEVEAVLRDDPAVRDVAVVPGSSAASDGTAGDHLLGYVVVADEDPVPVTARLQERARRQLPAYMVPARLIPLDHLPLTANGKLDRAALPTPDGERPAAGPEFVAPRTPVEEQVATVWRKALGVDQVGVNDDFFALGGHSLLAVRVVFLVRAELGRDVPVRTLFDHPTVASFTDHLPTGPAVAPIPRRARLAYQPERSSRE
jgi:acyl-coenzyme A synthetase/AMP-(fatty) acid ligase